jgi:hypothetical protein
MTQASTPIPGDVPLFNIPATPAPPPAKVPIGITPSYQAARERSGDQCEQVRPRDGKPHRCDHVARYYRLFLGADGLLRCEDCCKWVERQAKPKAARKPGRR